MVSSERRGRAREGVTHPMLLISARDRRTGYLSARGDGERESGGRPGAGGSLFPVILCVF